MMSLWKKTDEFQFVKKMSDTIFSVINIEQWIDGDFIATFNTIDVGEYNEVQIDEITRAYGYRDIDDLEAKYGKATNQILAECISELFLSGNDSIVFDDIQKVNDWLKAVSGEENIFIS